MARTILSSPAVSTVSIRIERYESRRGAEWDAFVRRARNGHFLAERGYLEYHGDRFADGSLMFFQGGRLLAVLPAHRRGDALVSHEGVPFAGLIVGPRMLHRHVRAAVEALLDYLRAEGLHRLLYTPTPVVYHATPFEDDVYVLREAGARCTTMKLSAGFPSPAPPSQSRPTARALRRAATKKELRFHEIDDVSLFWEHLGAFLRRRHDASPVHTEGEMTLLKARFPQAIRMVMAEAAGEIVAGALLYLTDRVSRRQYLFRTSDDEARVIARLHLHVAAMPEFRRAWNDLGTSIDPVTGRIDEGLLLSKEMLGARGTLVQTWTWDAE
jgi:hypothetical protein